MPGRIYEFIQLDVFTQTPLAGNPLAVFPDPRGLDDGEMQALAREMNLSETTFIQPRDAAIEAGRKESSHLYGRAGVAVRRTSNTWHSIVFVCVAGRFKEIS